MSGFALRFFEVGVFCHSAITGAEKDQDLLVQSLLQEKESFRERLLQLFRSFDDDGNGIITLLEFESRFEDESVRALFEALELGAALSCLTRIDWAQLKSLRFGGVSSGRSRNSSISTRSSCSSSSGSGSIFGEVVVEVAGEAEVEVEAVQY